jgi:hypothetical protein
MTSEKLQKLAIKYVMSHQHAINKMPEDLYKAAEQYLITLAEHVIRQEEFRHQTEIVTRLY